MFYKYTLNKDGIISMEVSNEYDGILNEVVGNTFVSDVERFAEEVGMLFELFKEEE